MDKQSKNFLRSSGCETIQKAILYIKNHQNVDLRGFRYLTDKDLEELQECTWIQHLFIGSYTITDDGIKFLKRMPLKSVEFRDCFMLTDKAFEYRKGMPCEALILAMAFVSQTTRSNILKKCH